MIRDGNDQPKYIEAHLMWHRVLLTTGTLMATLITNVRAAEVAATWNASAPGASLAWTSTDPTVADARKLVAAGKYSDAEALVKSDDAGDRAARDEMIEVIRRAREDYTLDDAQLLERIK